LPQQLPTLRWLTRPADAIEALAQRLRPALAAWAGERASVDVVAVHSQVGSGAMPADLLASHALRLVPRGKASGQALDRLAASLRALPTPVIGRIADGALLLDARCLDDEAGFTAQFAPAPAP
jgi:L-seryl-tRNA(Ser) seleniumtransferase